ncbi:hypothetical protein Q5H92_21865 [Hymenobacter sp. M29]|uniref:Uncharacterized protein n=1 Tax=Hymenobacter mellowenesis TaxID=3063995 RepID=A0ABT9AGN6_9BACT|nr:hypothetical protein [Hymenobacter sp. M29]MDO7849027.1 hypothetical protein [Hymenobacter sp. M29]
MVYSPIFYQGDVAQEIHSAVIASNRTSTRKLLRLEDDIKYQRVLTSISGELAWQEYKEQIREADIPGLAAVNNWKMGDRLLTPARLMAFDNITLSQLLKTRYAADMAAGAVNIGSTPFENQATGHLVPRLGKSYEKLLYTSITAATKASIAASNVPTASQKAWAAAQTPFLFDGIVANLIKAGIENPDDTVKAVTSTTVTGSNVGAEYAKIYAQIDEEELEDGSVVIYSPLADMKTITAANQLKEFKDTFQVIGTGKDMTVTYNNVPVEFVPTPARFAGYGGETGDFVHGTDLTSDLTSFKLDKVNAMSEDLFFKLVATACTTTLDTYKKVLYL